MVCFRACIFLFSFVVGRWLWWGWGPGVLAVDDFTQPGWFFEGKLPFNARLLLLVVAICVIHTRFRRLGTLCQTTWAKTEPLLRIDSFAQARQALFLHFVVHTGIVHIATTITTDPICAPHPGLRGGVLRLLSRLLCNASVDFLVLLLLIDPGVVAHRSKAISLPVFCRRRQTGSGCRGSGEGARVAHTFSRCRRRETCTDNT